MKKENQVYLMIQKLKENIGNNNLKKSFMFRVSRNFYADLF